MEKELKVLNDKVAALEGMVGNLLEENGALKESIAALKEPGSSVKVSTPKPAEIKVPKATFTVDKTKYRFKVGKFRIGVNSVIAADAMKDKTLLAEVVENYPGLVEKV